MAAAAVTAGRHQTERSTDAHLTVDVAVATTEEIQAAAVAAQAAMTAGQESARSVRALLYMTCFAYCCRCLS